MDLNYEQRIYEDYNDLKENDPILAKKLLKEVGKGDWMNHALYVYPDDWEFAKYELSNGWYFDMNFERDYNGAPDPLDYIDMNKFARALVNTWDTSEHIEIGDQIIETAYGWEW